MKITYEKEVLISQATPDVTEWGRWQFPRAWVMGGRIYVEFDDAHDSSAEYHLPKKQYFTEDSGATWRESHDLVGDLLPNGDIIKNHFMKPVKVGDLKLPDPIATVPNYALICSLYRAADLSDDLTAWYIDRYVKAEDKWIIEKIKVDFPDYVIYDDGEVIVPNFFWFFKVAPDKSLWGIWYCFTLSADGAPPKYSNAVFFRSDDFGHTWHETGRIVYHPEDNPNDPLADIRMGYTEPDLAFTDDGRMFSVMRTMDGHGNAPSYISWSEDGGHTWSKPEVFDDLGVWPQNVNLRNGAILECYGRPKLYTRVYYRGEWSERERVPELRDTCSYCAVVTLDEDDGSALLVFSDFSYPNADGVKCKTILCRKVHVEI